MKAALYPKIPDGWKAEWDANHKEWYYVNLYTQQSQWQKPVIAAEPLDSQRNFSRAPKPRNLPNGWAAEWHPYHKAWYFANTHTKQSQWQRPSGPATGSSSEFQLNADINIKQPHFPEPSRLTSLSKVEPAGNAIVNTKQARQIELAKPVQMIQNQIVGTKRDTPDNSLAVLATSTEQMVARIEKLPDVLSSERSNFQKPYHKLHDANSFRTLQLHRGFRKDPLGGTLLQPIQLEWGHTYDALSYRRSEVNVGKTKSIKIDGVAIPIGPDLYSALVQFRHEELPRNLWVDQVCINQNDKEETIQQLKIMAGIYSKAQTVLVWLGEGNNQSDIAMEFFPIFVELLQSKDDAARLHQSDDTMPVVIERGGKLASALSDLFERPWFGRVWTLQEAALGKTAEVWCGAKSFPFQVLERFGRGCENDEFGHWANAADSVESALGRPVTENLRRSQIAHIHIISVLKRGSTTSAYILNSLRNVDCSKDQDRIYSALRFFDLDFVREITSWKNPSVTELYHHVAVHGILRGELEHLGAAGLSQHRGTCAAAQGLSAPPSLLLPSWAPDWTFKVQVNNYWSYNRNHVNKKGTTLFAAGGSSLHRSGWSFSNNDMVWNATGVIVDEVRGCADPFRVTDTSEDLCDARVNFGDAQTVQEAIQSYISSCMKLAADCSPNYGSANIKRVCRRSLIGGIMPEGSADTLTGVFVRATDEDVDSLFEDFETSIWITSESENLAELARSASSSETNELIKEFKARMSILESAQQEIGDLANRNDLCNVIVEACKGRRFFTTIHNHYMGVAPEITRPGDKIVVIPGCCAPFVIRPGESRYQLIGECFVEGIMDGEIMASKKYSLQKIAFE